MRGKILNTWEVESGQVLASQEVHDLAVAIGCDPGKADISGLRYGKVVRARRRGFRRSAYRHTAVGAIPQALPHTGSRRPHIRRHAALFRVDVGKQVFYCLDEAERDAMLQKIEREKIKGAVNVTRFKGLGEMNPSQLRESTIHPDTRRLVQLTIGDHRRRRRRHRKIMDMLLSKKRAADRKEWLETKGDLARLEV